MTNDQIEGIMKIAWIKLAAVAALVFCLQTGAAFAASQGKFERSLHVSGAVSLEVETGSGNIEVRTGGSDQVQVTGWIRANDWLDGNADEKVRRLEANPPILQSGNDIRIGHIDDPDLRRNVSISFEVMVPANTTLRAHSGSGNATVDGVQGTVEVGSGSGGLKLNDIGSTVRADTGSGNIEIANVKGNVRAKTGSGSIRANGVAGGFEASTGSGNIVFEQTASGAVRAETGSGGIDLRSVHGSLEAKTGSGGIHADGDPTGAWTLHTGSGTVRLRFPQDASFDLNARTTSGSISVNHPVTVQGAISKKEVRGKVRSGGVPVEVATGSGDIEIE